MTYVYFGDSRSAFIAKTQLFHIDFLLQSPMSLYSSIVNYYLVLTKSLRI